MKNMEFILQRGEITFLFLFYQATVHYERRIRATSQVKC